MSKVTHIECACGQTRFELSVKGRPARHTTTGDRNVPEMA